MPMRWWGKLLLFGSMWPLAANAADPASADSSRTAVPSWRMPTLLATEAVAYGGAMTLLYQTWYKPQGLSHFRFFDDTPEWCQIDKAGHALTASYLAEVSSGLYRWAGLEKRKAAWIGAGQSLFFLTSLELFDGFSPDWGFSLSDMGANIFGAALFLGQELGWEEQRIRLKFSAHSTSYARYRPALLGSSTAERLLKDYNGQTYWLSVNIASFLADEIRFPRWLNVALGYGAEGMLGGRANPSVNEAGQVLPQFDRYRKMLVSLDVDLTRIPVRAQWLKSLFTVVNVIKIPFPAIEYSQGRWQGHGFYF